MDFIESLQESELHALPLIGQTCNSLKIRDGFTFGAQIGALKNTGKKSCTPVCSMTFR